MGVEITEEYRAAVSLLRAGHTPLLVAGRAGTGKSTFLSWSGIFLSSTQRSWRQPGWPR